MEFHSLLDERLGNLEFSKKILDCFEKEGLIFIADLLHYAIWQLSKKHKLNSEERHEILVKLLMLFVEEGEVK